jgi:hypothetical protein
MDNVEINNIRNDRKSELYYTNSLIENSIGSALSCVEHSLPSQPSPSSDFEEYLLNVSKVSCSLLYYSSSFLSMPSPNASCTLSINIPVTYYPADSCYYYYVTSPE